MESKENLDRFAYFKVRAQSFIDELRVEGLTTTDAAGVCHMCTVLMMRHSVDPTKECLLALIAAMWDAASVVLIDKRGNS